MSTKSNEENLIDFSSPLANIVGENATNSLGSNPFDTLSQIVDPFSVIDVEKDPLYLLKCDIADCGRESLGLLQIDLENIKFDDANWSNVPELRVNNLLQISTENLSDELNTAFLYSHRNSKLSATSSAPTSASSFPESLDFWELSEIKLPSSLINGTNFNSSSTFNRAFINNGTNNVSTLPKEKRSFTTEALKQLRTRIKSLPDVLQTRDFDIEKINDRPFVNPYLRNFRKSESLLKKSFMSPLVSKAIEAEDSEFNDSVFIEAKHIAEKIADNSILHLAGGELYLLDSTPQPELIDISDTTDENAPNCTESIFKAVDKMIPDTKDKDSELRDKEKSLEDHTNKSGNSGNSNSSLSRNGCLQSLSDIFNGDNKNLSTSKLSHCSNKSKSRDANSILHNLSTIINSENRSEQQKTEGQNLLFSLADILCNEDDNKNSLNEGEHSGDSGHSSIEQDIACMNKHETDNSFSALDLRVHAKTATDELKPLDLSISKLKRENEINKAVAAAADGHNDVKLKTSFKSTNNSVVNRNRSGLACFNNSKSLSNIKNISGLSAMGKLKPKKIDSKVVPEKGPLKAMIPVGSMSKTKGINKNGRASTPTKNNHTGCKLKRTSTPKMGSKPQPVAQSTPDANSNLNKAIPTPTHLQQRRFEVPLSPLARTSIGSESIHDTNTKNRSGSTPNLSYRNSKNGSTLDSGHTLSRRHSANDLKISNEVCKFRRSNTIDKDSGIAKSLTRVRENFEKCRSTAGTVAKPGFILKPNQIKPVLNPRNRVSSSTAKPCNLVNKIRTHGKENICE